MSAKYFAPNAERHWPPNRGRTAQNTIRTYLKRGGAFVATLCMVMSMLMPSLAFADDEVTISVAAAPKVDIAFAQGLTTNGSIVTGLENANGGFNKDLKAYISAAGRDTGGLNFVEAPAAEKVDFSSGFNWITDEKSDYVGAITINGADVEMTGNGGSTNRREPGNSTFGGPSRNLLYVYPPAGYVQKFTFSYSLNFGDSFNSAGMMLKIQDKGDGFLYGYAVSFQKSSTIDGSSNSGTNGAVWEVKWHKGSGYRYNGQNNALCSRFDPSNSNDPGSTANTHPYGVKKMQGLSLSTTGSVTIDSSDAGITITGGGLSSPVTVQTDKNWANGSGFGFYTDHYSHSCSNIGSFALRGINLKQTKSVSTTTVLGSPQWSDGSNHVLVNLNDYIDGDLDDASKVSSLVNRMQNDSVHYIAWGSDNNKTQLQDFIGKNDNRGEFFNTATATYTSDQRIDAQTGAPYTARTAYDAGIAQIGDYIIKNFYETSAATSTIFTVDDNLKVSVTPSTYATSEYEDSDYPDGVWKLIHDETYYANNTGKYELDKQYQKVIPSKLDKPGRYEIYFKGRIEPTTILEIHRKPVAGFTVMLDEDDHVVITSSSYDLDSNENIGYGNGIVEEKWEYKKATSNQWTERKPTTADLNEANTTYNIRLRVKDQQGVWSDPVVKDINTQSNEPPTASYTLASTEINRYSPLVFSDQSFDPRGKALAKWTWKLIYIDPNGKEILKDTIVRTKDDGVKTPPSNYTYENYGQGNYRWDLVVTNARSAPEQPQDSESFGRTFIVLKDQIAPSTPTINLGGGTSSDDTGNEGGTENQPTNLGTEVGTKTKTPPAPTRDGYIFKEWNTKADGSGRGYGPEVEYEVTAGESLYAIWVLDTSTTGTLNYEGGTTGDGQQQPVDTTTEVGDTITIPEDTPTKDGSTFVGWNTEPDGTGTTYQPGDDYTVKPGEQLYAQFEEGTNPPKEEYVKVTLKANGGTGNDVVRYYPKDQDAVVPVNSFTPATDTVFDNWNTKQAGSGTSYTEGAPFTPAEDMVLFAQWKSNPATGTINYGGGTAPGGNTNKPTEPTKVDEGQQVGDTVILPAAPTRDGYIFKEYNTDPEGNGESYQPGDEYEIKADEGLYAIWEPSPTNGALNYEGGSTTNGTTEGSDPTTPEVPVTTDGQIGDTITIPEDTPTKDDSTFVGWNTKPDGTGTTYQPGDDYTVKPGEQLYAQFEDGDTPPITQYVTVTLKAGGVAGSDVVRYYPKGKPAAVPANQFVPAQNTVFDEWNTQANGAGTAYAAGSTFTPRTNMTFYAQWKTDPATGAVNYGGANTVDYNDRPAGTINYEGGTKAGDTPGTASEPDKLGTKVGETVTLPGAPTREGYEFQGYNTQADGSGRMYQPGATYVTKADEELYAIWTPVEETGALNYGGGTVEGSGSEGEETTAPSNVGNKPGETVSIPDNTPTKEGSTFVGWNTEPDGTGTTYQPGDDYTIKPGEQLYAQYEDTSTNPGESGESGQPGTDPGSSGSDPSTQPAESTVVKVTLKANGGTGEDIVHNYRKGTTAAVPTNKFGAPANQDKVFDKWTTEADGTGTAYEAGASFAPTEDIVLFAQWKSNPVTGTINYGGGTAPGDTPGEESDPTKLDENKQVGDTVTLPAAPTREGYSFIGYNTVENPTEDNPGTTYPAGSDYTIKPGEQLYAQWQPIPEPEEVEPEIPAEGAQKGVVYKDGMATVTFSEATDDPTGSGIAGYIIVPADSNGDAPETPDANEGSWVQDPTFTVADGTYYVYVKDADGNVSAPSDPVIIEPKLPTISVSTDTNPFEAGASVIPDSLKNNKPVIASVKIGANTKNIDKFEYAFTTTPEPPTTGWTTSSSMSEDINTSGSNKWYVHARCADGEGGYTIETTGPFYVDVDNPVVQSITPNAYNNTFTATITAKDDMGAVNGFAVVPLPAGTDSTTFDTTNVDPASFTAATSGAGTQDDPASANINIEKPGKYIILVRDDAGNIKVSDSIDVGDITVAPASTPWGKEGVAVDITVNGNLVTIGNQTYNLDSLYFRLDDQSTSEYDAATGGDLTTTTSSAPEAQTSTEPESIQTIFESQPEGDSVESVIDTVVAEGEAVAEVEAGILLEENQEEPVAVEGEGKVEEQATSVEAESEATVVEEESQNVAPEANTPDETWTPLSLENGKYSLVIQGDGLWYLHLYGTYAQGATMAKTEGSYGIDTVSPTIDSINTAYVNNGAKLTVNASDTLSGVSRYALVNVTTTDNESNTDGESVSPESDDDPAELNWQESNEFTLSEPGTYNVYVKDAAGNESEVSQVIVESFVAPTISATPESSKEGSDKLTIAVSIEADQPGNETWRYVVDAKSTEYTSAADSKVWSSIKNGAKGNVELTEAGTYYLHVLAADGDNNTAYATFGPYVINKQALDVTYTAHSQTYGWNAPSGKNGTVAGTTGQSKRLEAITAKVTGGTIEYRSHLQGIGWESTWVRDGAVSGTTGQSRRLEAIQMRMVGGAADKGYHVWYRVHSQTYGWLGWAKDGETAGTAGQSKRAEAYQVVVLADGVLPPDYDASRPAYLHFLKVNAHVRGNGWLGEKQAGIVGTTGQYRRLEALAITLPNSPVAGGIRYSTHLKSRGWTGWSENGAISGTTGESRRMEAVKIELTGEMAKQYSVWYRVHSQTYGWLGWAKDGEVAGTTGLSKRAEAVDVQILPKGTVPLGYNATAASHTK